MKMRKLNRHRQIKKSGHINFHEYCLAMSKFEMGQTKKFPHVKYVKARYEEDRYTS